MTDPLTAARALLERSQSPWAARDVLSSEALDLLPDLLGHAEKQSIYVAMLEECMMGFMENNCGGCTEQEAREELAKMRVEAGLAVEAGNWRKIGEEEQRAIENAIAALDWPDQETIDVLRKLLEGLP